MWMLVSRQRCITSVSLPPKTCRTEKVPTKLRKYPRLKQTWLGSSQNSIIIPEWAKLLKKKWKWDKNASGWLTNNYWHRCTLHLPYSTLQSVNWLAWLHMVFPRLTKLFLRWLYQTPIFTFWCLHLNLKDLLLIVNVAKPNLCQCQIWLCCPCLVFSEVGCFFLYRVIYTISAGNMHV